MDAFSLGPQPAMILQPGAARGIGDAVSELMGGPTRVMMVADPALRALRLCDGAETSLREAGHGLVCFEGLTSDPKEQSVDDAVALGRKETVDCVVGLGGGAALDVAKLAAALLHADGTCADYRLAVKPLPFRRTGLVCVPTTAGTGSETTATSIISQPDGTKNWFWGRALRADVAVLDPELTVDLPAFWTFATGMDALVHAVESRTNRYRFPANDALAERAIELASRNLVAAVESPTDIAARGAMLHAASLAGLAIGNTGCAIAHNAGHALGSLAAIPHGRAVSVALVATLDWTIEGNREAFDRVGQLLGGKDASAVGPWMRDAATQCRQTLTFAPEERGDLNAKTLAEAMVAPANIAMLHSTARDASEAEVAMLAEQVLAA